MRAWRFAWLRFVSGATGLGGIVVLAAGIQTLVVLLLAAVPAMQADAVQERIAALSPSARWLAITSSDLGDARVTTAHLATRLLRGISDQPVASDAAYRPLSDERYGRYQLVASGHLQDSVDLASGRLPARCDAALCEVVALNGRVSRVPQGLQVVGFGRLRAEVPLTRLTEQGCPLLAAADPDAIASMSGMASVGLVSAWTGSIDPTRVSALGIAGYVDDLAAVSDALALAGNHGQLTAPTTQLLATAAQVDALHKRFLSLVLIFGLVALFAGLRMVVAQRGGHLHAMRIAHQYGWSTAERRAATAATALFPALIGSCIGSAFGVVGGRLLGVDAQPPVTAWWSTLLVAASGFLLVCMSLRSHVAGAIAAAGLGLAVVGGAIVWRLDLAMLGILLIAAAVAVCIPLVMQFFTRHMFTANLIRSHSGAVRSLVVVTALLSAFAMASLAQRDTLRAATRDHAIFTSPLAERITWADRSPLDVADIADYRRLSNGANPWPVRRLSGSIRGTGFDDVPLQLLAVQPQVWRLVPDISRQTGMPNEQLAQLVAARPASFGIDVRGRKSMSGTLSGLGPRARITIWFVNGDFQSTSTLVDASASGAFTLRLPADAQALVGVTVFEEETAALMRAHAVGEGRNTIAAPEGDVQLRNLRLDDSQDALDDMRWHFSLVQGPEYHALVMPPAQIDAIVDRQSAVNASDGLLPVALSSGATVRLHVRAVAEHLPTVGERFALVDMRAIDQFLAATSPASLRVSDLWLASPLRASASSADIVQSLTVIRQADVEAMSLASSAAQWNARAFDVLLLFMLGLFAMLALTLVGSIRRTWDVEAWIAQGASTRQLVTSYTAVMTAGAAMTAAASSACVLALFPLTLMASGEDLTGSPASPPLVALMHPGAFALIAIGAVIATVLVVLGSFRRTTPTRSSGWSL